MGVELVDDGNEGLDGTHVEIRRHGVVIVRRLMVLTVVFDAEVQRGNACQHERVVIRILVQSSTDLSRGLSCPATSFTGAVRATASTYGRSAGCARAPTTNNVLFGSRPIMSALRSTSRRDRSTGGDARNAFDPEKPFFFAVERHEQQRMLRPVCLEIHRQCDEACRAGRIVIGAVEDDAIFHAEVIVVRAHHEKMRAIARAVEIADHVDARPFARGHACPQ